MFKLLKILDQPRDELGRFQPLSKFLDNGKEGRVIKKVAPKIGVSHETLRQA